ncbi:MAG TPA: hypothetical protein VLA04_02705 [Verrucomicrobiae bacterium]|nr:hypothetical protein [Verrucomicrobiae bacterium]
MKKNPSYAGYSANDLMEKLLQELMDIQGNPVRFSEAAEYLSRTELTMERWIKAGEARLLGETFFYVLGFLEKNGRIPRLPNPDSSNLELALCVALARKQVTAADIVSDLGLAVADRVYSWAKGETMVSFSRFRALWALSKRQIIGWEWFTALPEAVQHMVVYGVENPTKDAADLEKLIPSHIAGRTSIGKYLVTPGRFMNEDLQAFLLQLNKIPTLVEGESRPKPEKGAVKVEVSQPLEPHDGSLVSLLAQMNPANRIIALAEVLLADLRLVMHAGDVSSVARALEGLRSSDRREVLFKLENILGVVNAAEAKVIARWLKEELR